METENLKNLLQITFPNGEYGESFITTVTTSKHYKILSKYSDETLASVCVLLTPATDEWEVIVIATHPNFQGQGNASTLIKKAIILAKENNIKKLHLEVSEKNQTAISFYKKHNFNQVGKRKDYYKKGEHAVLFAHVFPNL